MIRNCKKCGATKPLEEFVKAKGCSDGRSWECKACRADRMQNWRKTSGYQEPRASERAKERYRRNRDRAIELAAEWAKRNPEKRRALGRAKFHRRKARLSAGGSFTVQEIEVLKVRQRHKCAACQESLKAFEIDHVMPLAKGGSNRIENIQLLCRPCNRRKSAKHPIDFMQEMGKLL